MEKEDYRYSVQVKVKDEWQWILGTNDLSSAKHHLRCEMNKHPSLMGRVIDKSTGQTVFIDPDPNALKICFRENETDDWRSLELVYVDEEDKWLNVRDGSMMGIWLPLDQVHPDDREATLEFGRKLERREYTPEQTKAWGEFYRILFEEAERLRRMMAQKKGNAGSKAD